MTLDELIKLAGANVTFDETNYPALKDASDEQKLVFALHHSALHFSKTAGKLAAAVEDVDHGNDLDMENLKANVWKSFINTAWLAEKIGMPEAEIVAAIREKYSKE